MRDQCHITATVAGLGIHIYIRPNNNKTSAEHYVTHVSTGRKYQRRVNVVPLRSFFTIVELVLRNNRLMLQNRNA